MKKIIAAIALLAAVAAPAAFVTNNFRAPGGPGTAPFSMTNRVPITFAPTQTPFITSNGTVVYSVLVQAWVTNGILSPVWIEAGNYQVAFGPQNDYGVCGVPYSTNTFSLWSIMTNVNAITNFPQLPGVSSVVAGAGIAVANSGSVYTVSSTGSATNVPTLTAASGITIVTNGSPNATNYTISSTGGGSSSVTVANISGNSSGLSAATNGSTITVTATNNPYLSSLTGSLGTAAYSNAVQFYGTNANLQAGSQILSNFSTLGTNAFYNTNANLQAGNTALSNFAALGTNAFQAASQILSNFVTLGTNAFYNTNANLQAGTTTLSNFNSLGTNAFYNTNVNLQSGSTILSNIAAGSSGAVPSNTLNTVNGNGLTTLNASQLSSGTIPSSVLPYALSNSSAFVASTNGVANGTLTTTNSPWQHLETNWGWIDTSNGVKMSWLSNGQYFVSSNVTIGGSLVVSNSFSSDNGNFASDGSGNVTANTFSGTLSNNFLSSIGNESGMDNFFAGPSSGNTTVSGIENTAWGYNNMPVITSGSYNTSLGSSVLDFVSSGSDNTAIGYGALQDIATMNDNTAIGYEAMFDMQTGSNNTAVGSGVLEGGTGSFNTAVGFQSLYFALSSNNIALGNLAGYNIAAGSSNIDIGNSGLSTDTNSIRIGQSQTNVVFAGVNQTSLLLNNSGVNLTSLPASQLTGTVPFGAFPQTGIGTNGNTLQTTGSSLSWVAPSAGGSVTFNSSQFNSSGSQTNIASNAIVTNLTIAATGQTPLSITGKTNGYNEIALGNINTNTNASSDLTFSNANTTSSTWYADVGYNGSGFNNTNNPPGGSNDAYFITQGDSSNSTNSGGTNGNNIWIGTGPANSVIHFFNGNTNGPSIANNAFTGNAGGLTNLTLNANSPTYPTGTQGFTNGTGGGLALHTNAYYTNQFGRAISVSIENTNGETSTVWPVIYIFNSAGTEVRTAGAGTLNATLGTNWVNCVLYPNEYLSVSNGLSASGSPFNIMTNQVTISP